jgi:hypothetical protein
MAAVTKYSLGLRYGFITGTIYFILLFCRYKIFSSDSRRFVICAVVSYFIILIMYLITAIARKRELGGYGTMNEIFTAVFIVILLTELIYIVFNLIYFKLVDPSFWENFRTATRTQLQMAHVPNDQIEQQMNSFKEMEAQTSPGSLIKGYGISVVIDSVFGLIFAIILRKPNTPVKK